MGLPSDGECDSESALQALEGLRARLEFEFKMMSFAGISLKCLSLVPSGERARAARTPAPVFVHRPPPLRPPTPLSPAPPPPPHASADRSTHAPAKPERWVRHDSLSGTYEVMLSEEKDLADAKSAGPGGLTSPMFAPSNPIWSIQVPAVAKFGVAVDPLSRGAASPAAAAKTGPSDAAQSKGEGKGVDDEAPMHKGGGGDKGGDEDGDGDI